MADIHVTPIDDLRVHTESRDCWCCPLVEWVVDFDCADPIVVHHSADGRELIEQHGVQ